MPSQFIAVNLSLKISIYFRTQGWKCNNVATSIWKNQNVDIPKKAYSTVARHSLKKNTNSHIKKKLTESKWSVCLSIYYILVFPCLDISKRQKINSRTLLSFRSLTLWSNSCEHNSETENGAAVFKEIFFFLRERK